jgi:putative tryptophan/tyrosine transport system substrate-binding protein
VGDARSCKNRTCRLRPTGRRQLMALIACSLIAPGIGARAQAPSPRPLIGVLWHAASPEEEEPYRTLLHAGFAKLGYIDGQNVAFEERYPAEQLDRFREYAEELVRLKVDVLVAITAAAARAAKAATTTIPIVFNGVADPVAIGLVPNLSRPGGNSTGFSMMSRDLQPKRLQILKEVVPGVSRLALLAHPTNGYPPERDLADLQPLLQEMRMHAEIIRFSTIESLDTAFSAIAGGGFDAVFVTLNPYIYVDAVKQRIAALGIFHRLPIMSPAEVLAEAGALMSYGPKWQDTFLGVAPYVDRILKGAKPGDLPVQQPSAFQLVINLKTAKAIGVQVPEALIAGAERLVE